MSNLKGLQIGWELAKSRKNPNNSLVCPVCFRSFQRKGLRKFDCKTVCCSKKCSGRLRTQIGIDGFNKKRRIGPLIVCKKCGNAFRVPPSQGNQKFCSMKCRANDPKSFDCIRGNRHYNWKGGTASKNQQLRRDSKYREWRTRVFKRDNYKCHLCHEIGHKLEAHHRKPWAIYPELRFDVENGITFCRKCHAYIHKWTKQLLEDYENIICQYA